MSTDPDNPLDPLRRGAATPLDEKTLDRIEARLRVQHATQRPSPTGRRVPRWVVVGPVLALVLIMATIALVVRDESAVAALELRNAEDVTVTQPDGTVVSDPADGFALVDGAVVVVGVAGTVTIDDVTLSGGTVVTVRDGRLVTDVVATTTTDGPDDPDRNEPARDAPPADANTTSSTTVPPSPTTSRVPADDAEPRRPPEPSLTTTTSAAPPGDGPRSPDDRPPETDRTGDIAVALRVDARDGGVRLAWNSTGVEGPGWRVVVVRTADGSEPLDLSGSTLVAEGNMGELVERRADLPVDIVALRYRVLVLDEADGVVARSAVQTLAVPDS